MTEVLIDGVRYVPATEAAAGVADLLRVLALQFDDGETLATYGTTGLRVLVSDDLGEHEGESFDELAARLAAAVGER
jgi:hypothetical protein